MPCVTDSHRTAETAGSDPSGGATPAGGIASDTTGGSLIRGGAWQSAGNVMPQLYTLAISVAAARFLGPERLGRQSFIAFVALSVVMVLSLGVALSLQRSIAESVGRGRADEARALAGWGTRVLLAMALLGGAGVALPGLLGATPGPAWLLAGLATALAIAHAAPSSALLGVQRFREAARVGLATGLLAVVGTVLVLALGGGIAGLFAVEAVVSAVNLAWTSALARRSWRRLGQLPRPSPALRRATARYGGFMTLSIMLSYVAWRRSEFFFLAYYSTDTQIALYSIAFAATAAVSALPERLSQVMVSAFATLLGAGAHGRIRSAFSRSLRLILLFTVVLTAAALATGPEAVTTVYGHKYREAGQLLLILLLIIPFVPLWHLSNSLLTGLGEVRAPLLTSATAAAVNLALAFLLIPSLEAVGAALANTGGQLCATAVAFAFARRRIGRVDWRLPWLLRGVAVSALAGLATWAVADRVGGGLGLALGLAAGAVALSILASKVHVLSADDAGRLEADIGSALGGRMGTAVRLVAEPAAKAP